MKKLLLMVLATVAAMLIGIGSLTPAQGSDIVVSVPGKMILSDSEGDFLLRECNPLYPLIPCSVPFGASLDLPGYLDIRQAGITQIGRRTVDLTIKTYEPIPAVPTPYSYAQYYWQFGGGCVVIDPNIPPLPGAKSGIHVTYSCVAGECKWRASWLEITRCSPRESKLGDDVPFIFTDNGVRVRVPLDDLLTAVDSYGAFSWHTGVRLVRFGNTTFTNSIAVDFCPDVVYFNETPPPFIISDELPAIWEPR